MVEGLFDGWEPAGIGRDLEGYPLGWRWASWIIRAQAGWRCEHCGQRFTPGDRVLTTHHLDGDVDNLAEWNLVPLCLRHHGLVGRWVRDLDAAEELVQESLLGDGPTMPWLARRLQERRGDLGERRLERRPPSPRPPAPTPAGQAVLPSPVLTAADVERCACGCGRAVVWSGHGRRRAYATQACRERAHRARSAEQTAMFDLMAKGENR